MGDEDLTRRLTFSAWADLSEKHPFNRLAAAEALSKLKPADLVFGHTDALTAVELVQKGDASTPTYLQLLALHDAQSAPSSWGPGQGASLINLGTGQYSAFITHVAIWDNKIVAHDAHANAPGLGRLAAYLMDKAEGRVAFRALYEQGLANQLSDLEGLRGLDFAIHNPHKLQNATGMLGSLIPQVSSKVPSIQVSVGMGRRGPRDAYLPDDIAKDVHEIADKAEQLFDTLKIKGKSKTEKTPAGKPKTVELNLLSHRLHVVRELPRDKDNPGIPDQAAVFGALSSAHDELRTTEALEKAVEARLLLDGS
jgi:hypothetical protein